MEACGGSIAWWELSREYEWAVWGLQRELVHQCWQEAFGVPVYMLKRTTGKPSASWVAEAASLLTDLGTWLSRILLDLLTPNHWPTPASAGNHRRPKPLSPAVSLQCSLLKVYFKGEMFILKEKCSKEFHVVTEHILGFIMELRGNKLMSSTQEQNSI